MSPQERAEFISDIAAALTKSQTPLTDDEQRWVRLAIEREAKSAEFRSAIITKTVGGLVWSALLGIGYVVIDFLKLHGAK